MYMSERGLLWLEPGSVWVHLHIFVFGNACTVWPRVKMFAILKVRLCSTKLFTAPIIGANEREYTCVHTLMHTHTNTPPVTGVLPLQISWNYYHIRDKQQSSPARGWLLDKRYVRFAVDTAAPGGTSEENSIKVLTLIKTGSPVTLTV